MDSIVSLFNDHAHFKLFVKHFLSKLSVGRLILSKAPGIRDEYADRDAEDITHQYKNKEGTTAERLAVFNAVRGVDK